MHLPPSPSSLAFPLPLAPESGARGTSRAGGAATNAPGATTVAVRHRAAVVWAVVGSVAVLVEAIVRLGALALEGWRLHASVPVGAAYLAFMAMMIYFEGWRGFHRSFAPRFARRVLELGIEGSRLERALAPFVAMGLCHAPRRVLVVSWVLVGGIVGCIAWVRTLPQPTRGIVDGGVAVALSFGALSMLWHLRRIYAEGQEHRLSGATRTEV